MTITSKVSFLRPLCSEVLIFASPNGFKIHRNSFAMAIRLHCLEYTLRRWQHHSKNLPRETSKAFQNEPQEDAKLLPEGLPTPGLGYKLSTPSACLPACLSACLLACLLACLPACLLARLPACACSGELFERNSEIRNLLAG